ncbi:MAG: hypothetical protein JSW39_03405 [Desulfobacterales bacterium]|nr:MAG: hypothetical protein JSW39_03405 [Desulfobacterales bacterium]
MTPIYFPLTYLAPTIGTALTGYFRQVIVYRPAMGNLPEEMQRMAENGGLEVRMPMRGDEQRIETALQSFQSWARLHHGPHGRGKDFLKYCGRTVPFFDDTSASQIIADIKRSPPQGSAVAPSDRLFCARLFLALAQEYDRQSYEIERDLRRYDQLAQGLINDLKGEDELFIAGSRRKADLRSEDPAQSMFMERLEAWACLMRNDSAPGGLFVTNSRLVCEHLIESTPSATKIFHAEGTAWCQRSSKDREKWREQFGARLLRLANSQWPTAVEGFENMPVDRGYETPISLTLYLVPGQGPLEFFAGCLGRQSLDPIKLNRIAKTKNTLFGLLEC